MGRVNIWGGLLPEVQAAIAEENRIADETLADLGLSEADPNDAALQRKLYNANRAYWNEGGPTMADRKDLSVGAHGGELPIRIHYPVKDQPLPALVFLHGGGYVLGNLETHDRIMRQLAADSGCAVVGVDYRLAPEVRFPACFDDALTAVEWVAEHGGDHDLDVGRIAIGGDSAGAALSLAAMMHLRDQSRAIIKVGLLYYGAYGLRDSRSRRLYGGVEDGLSPETLAFFKRSLLGPGRPPEDWRLNMLNQSVAGLPPLLIGPVEMDPLRDDSDTLQELCKDSAVPHEYHLFTGVLHGFLHMSRMVGAARTALALGGDFLRRHV